MACQRWKAEYSQVFLMENRFFWIISGKVYMSIEIIRSKRKTIAIQIIDSSEVKVRAPLRMSQKAIKDFIDKNSEWISRKQQEAREKEIAAESVKLLNEIEIKELTDRAREVFTRKVQYYAAIIGVDWNRITIRNQKSRWGSCSQKGNLNFNVALMRAPIEVLDYVVIHELCHRKEMNHSPKFWYEVERVMPDYRKYEKWLKDNGKILLAEIHGH